MAERTCQQCSGEIPTNAAGRGRPRIYCSKRCSRKASRDMVERTCSVDGCERPHGARGMCYSHYGTWHRQTKGRNDQTFDKVCIVCGEYWVTRRSQAKYCSVQCKGEAYRKVSHLPTDHPVIALIARAKAEAREVARDRRRERDRERSRSDFAWRIPRECPGCACWFTPLYTPKAICCSQRCVRRVHRWRRNAAERNAIGTFTWSQFMAIARRFDYCCAYCGEKPGRLDPDHVVPLSRGGINSTTNLLPSCHPCNGDKRDLLLDEWALDRERRGRPPRATSWAPDDKRYWHLTQAMLASPAA